MIDPEIYRTLKYNRPPFVFVVRKPVDSCIYNIKMQIELANRVLAKELDK